jgi:hypothetical protein
MMLKLERGTTPPKTRLLCCFSSELHMEGTLALPSTARIASSGMWFWGEQHFYECSLSLERFLLCCPWGKTEYFVTAFELFNIAAFLRGFPSPATKILSHYQVLSFTGCTTSALR